MDTHDPIHASPAIDRKLLAEQIFGGGRYPREDELEALRRLLKLARYDSGQCSRVAEFLLAWWNAQTCGGFDVMDVGSLDPDLAADVVVVFGMVACFRLYPSDLSQDLVAEFRELVAIWHPEFFKE